MSTATGLTRAPVPVQNSPATARAARGTRGARLVWASVGLSLLCLAIALRNAPLAEIGRTLRDARVSLAVPLLAALTAFYWLKALRWKWLLRPVTRTTTPALLRPMMIGFMGNNVLPARLGELVRVCLGAQMLGIAPSPVVATLVVERVFDFSAVLALLGAGIMASNNVPRSILSAGYVAAGISGVALVGLGVFVVWSNAVLRLVAKLTRRLPAKVGAGLQRQLALAATGLGALRQPRLLAGIVGTSLAQWLLMALCVYVSCRAVGVAAPFPAALVVLGVTVFGVMVPAAPGFFGTLHLSFVLALTPFGVSAERAMAAAVFYHAIPYVAVTVAGLVFLRGAGMRLQDIQHFD